MAGLRCGSSICDRFFQSFEGRVTDSTKGRKSLEDFVFCTLQQVAGRWPVPFTSKDILLSLLKIGWIKRCYHCVTGRFICFNIFPESAGSPPTNFISS